jgi:hypothetical protein
VVSIQKRVAGGIHRPTAETYVNTYPANVDMYHEAYQKFSAKEHGLRAEDFQRTANPQSVEPVHRLFSEVEAC